jgi:hypothetical protein
MSWFPLSRAATRPKEPSRKAHHVRSSPRHRLDDHDLVPVRRRAVAVLDRVLVDLVVEDSHVRSSEAVLAVQETAHTRERVPGGRQRFADRRRLDCEGTVPACVGRQERGQPDFDGGYGATLMQRTRAKLAGSRDQLSPSSVLANTSPPVVPT